MATVVPVSYQEICQLERTNGNAFHQTVTKTLKKSSCPITVRKCIEADISAALRKQGLSDGQSMRVKSCFAFPAGLIACIPTRLFRAVFRTAILVVPIGPLYALGKASRYHLKGEVKDHCKCTGEEWVDVGAASAAVFIAACKVFKKDAFHNGLEKLEEYYLKRAFTRLERDSTVEQAKAQYRLDKQKIKDAWKNGTAPVSFTTNSAVQAVDSGKKSLLDDPDADNDRVVPGNATGFNDVPDDK